MSEFEIPVRIFRKGFEGYTPFDNNQTVYRGPYEIQWKIANNKDDYQIRDLRYRYYFYGIAIDGKIPLPKENKHNINSINHYFPLEIDRSIESRRQSRRSIVDQYRSLKRSIEKTNGKYTQLTLVEKRSI